MRVPHLFLVVLMGIATAMAAEAAAADLRLITAAKNQAKEESRALLAKGGIDVNAADLDGTTALHWAAHWNDVDTVDALLKAGARASVPNRLGATPLWLASEHGGSRIVAKLLAAGADPNAALQNGETALMTAARAGSLEAVKLLLARGANVNAKETLRDQTALHWAAAQGHADVVRALVDANANLEAVTTVRPILKFVGANGRRDDVPDPTTVIKEMQGGYTPLLFAARNGDVESAGVLLGAGADINRPAADGLSPLSLSIFSGQFPMALMLIDKGANVNEAGPGYTPLHIAVLRRQTEVVEALLMHGADRETILMQPSPRRRTTQDWSFRPEWVGGTAYWLATRLGRPDLMRLLAKHGANTRFVTADRLQPDPEAEACEREGPKCARYYPQEPGRETAIMAAILGSREGRGGDGGEGATIKRFPLPDVINTVLELGADVNAADESGNTAVHLATKNNMDSLIELFVARGANVNAKNLKGQTPLRLLLTPVPGGYVGGGLGRAPDPKIKIATEATLRKLGGLEE